MRFYLFIYLLFSVFLIANTPVSGDLTNARLVNGNGQSSNFTSEISIVIDINSSNIVQFNNPNSDSSTTLTKGNPDQDILLNKITYDAKHPKIAKIIPNKLIFVFDLVDKNSTADEGNIVIQAGVLRDGKRGGATHLGSFDKTVADKAYPVLLEAITIDNDGNGHIDNIKLSFSESVQTNTTYNNGFSVSSYTVLGISSYEGIGENNSSPNSNDVYLRLQEKTYFDTEARPSGSYSEKLSNKLQDSNENNITSISSFSIQDKIKPLLVSASASSIHNGRDIIKVGFSEPIFKPLIPVTDISIGGGTSIAGAIITFFNNDKNITIELNESMSEGFITTTSISVYMSEHAKDKNNNNFTISTKNIDNIELETTKPKLKSISKVGDKRDFLVSFSEAMGAIDSNGISIKYNRNINNIQVETITLSENRKTAILNVLNLPVFTETEERILTFVMNNTVKDLAGNSIDNNESNISYTIAKDITPPNAKTFKVNMNTKTITIDFNETIALGTFNPQAILITRSNEGNISLTSNSKAIWDNSDTSIGKIIITLNDDINSLKAFLKGKEDFNISIFSNSGIIDYAGNLANSLNIPLSLESGSFVADNVAPKLLNWEYDLDHKKMILNFDEPMKIVDYNASDINISDSNTTFTNKITFSSNSSSAKATDKSIEITLFGSQIISILNDDLAKDINHTFLEINANSSFKDMKDNSVQTLSNSSSLKAKTYEVNKNKIAKLVVVPNTWNHISIDRPTKSSDVFASGQVPHIYTYKDEKWIKSSDILDPKVGYWIKANKSSPTTLEIPTDAKTYLKGKKSDDLARIRSKIDGTFHLIGIENNVSYEEIHNSKNSACKSMRVHHYDSASGSSAGWDRNSTILENSSLWVLCVK